MPIFWAFSTKNTIYPWTSIKPSSSALLFRLHLTINQLKQPKPFSKQPSFSQDEPHSNQDRLRPCQGHPHPYLRPHGLRLCLLPLCLKASWCGPLAGLSPLVSLVLFSARRKSPVERASHKKLEGERSLFIQSLWTWHPCPEVAPSAQIK
jgi:hypothetical protein